MGNGADPYRKPGDVALVGVAFAPHRFAMLFPLFFAVMATLGTGNGAVFQLVPQRFAAEIGVMTGLVGMAGGIGGFYLASSLGLAKQWTGSFAPGFLIFAALALVALAGLTLVKAQWRRRWGAAAGVCDGCRSGCRCRSMDREA